MKVIERCPLLCIRLDWKKTWRGKRNKKVINEVTNGGKKGVGEGEVKVMKVRK